MDGGERIIRRIAGGKRNKILQDSDKPGQLPSKDDDRGIKEQGRSHKVLLQPCSL